METASQCWSHLCLLESFPVQTIMKHSYSPRSCYVIGKLLKSHFGFCLLYSEEQASEWIRWNIYGFYWVSRWIKWPQNLFQSLLFFYSIIKWIDHMNAKTVPKMSKIIKNILISSRYLTILSSHPCE